MATTARDNVFAVPALPTGGPVVSQDREPGLVETFSVCCLHLGQAIWAKLGSETSRWRREKDRKNFQEALGQLVMWNSVAYNLDETLDAKEDLRTTILELLLGLGKVLLKWPNLFKRGLGGGVELETLTTSIERAEFLVNGGGSSEDESSLSESSETGESPKENKQNRVAHGKSAWIETFLTYATCLMDLIPSAEDPVHEQGNEEKTALPSEASDGVSTSDAAQAFATKIRDLFPTADAEVVKRLATLNLQRSLRIIRVQNGENLAADEERSSAPKAASEKGPASLAPPSSFRDSGLGTSAMTISKYAPSLASIASEMSTSLLRVPPMPKQSGAYGKGFVCTICGEMCRHIHTRAEWKRHVYLDLGTYTCLKHPSEKDVRYFHSRATLAAHEFLHHLRERQCLSCNEIVSTEAWESHVQQQHGSSHALNPTYQSIKASTTDERCPLCQESFGSSELQYGTHLGHHLEQIALASIPRNIMFDADDYDANDGDAGDDGDEQEDDEQEDDEQEDVSETLELDGNAKEESPRLHRTRARREAISKPRATFQCHLCPKRFTQAFNLRSHLRSHTDERPFACSVCNKGFLRNHDRKRHEATHRPEKRFVCQGELDNGGTWGCGRRFARADALGRHFRSETGRQCITPLIEEEAEKRAEEARQHPEEIELPPSLLRQYPALGQIDWVASAIAMADGSSGEYTEPFPLLPGTE